MHINSMVPSLIFIIWYAGIGPSSDDINVGAVVCPSEMSTAIDREMVERVGGAVHHSPLLPPTKQPKLLFARLLKDPVNGTLHPGIGLVFLPWLVAVYLVWFVKHFGFLRRFTSYANVYVNIYI